MIKPQDCFFVYTNSDCFLNNLSKIVVEMKKINNDNDKYEKKNAEIAAKELLAKFTNEDFCVY